jgi:hypothetical protein
MFYTHCGPGFDSASKRNEYQESSLGGKVWPAHKADKLTASVSRLSIKCESIDVSQSYGPTRPGIGIDLPLKEHKTFDTSAWELGCIFCESPSRTIVL